MPRGYMRALLQGFEEQAAGDTICSTGDFRVPMVAVSPRSATKNADRPVFVKVMKSVAPLLLGITLLMPAVELSAAMVEYDLTIARKEMNFTGQPVETITVNGQLPAPTLRFTEGDHAVIRVHNQMDVETSIHWHGILLPNAMDGVPFVTQPPIAPGQTFTYEFDLRQSGTYWYHSHTKLQEQRGLYGALVITEEKWETRAESSYLLSKHFSLVGQWHSEFGWGGGLRWQF